MKLKSFIKGIDVVNGQKRCSHCKRLRKATEFNKRMDGGLMSWCKQCTATNRKAAITYKKKLAPVYVPRPAPKIFIFSASDFPKWIIGAPATGHHWGLGAFDVIEKRQETFTRKDCQDSSPDVAIA